MNPHRVRADIRPKLRALFVASKRAGCNRDMRNMLQHVVHAALWQESLERCMDGTRIRVKTHVMGGGAVEVLVLKSYIEFPCLLRLGKRRSQKH